MLYKTHINNVANKLRKSYYLISNLIHRVSLDTVILAYQAYVNSHLMYGIIFWGTSTHVKDLFIIQKKIIRLIAGVNSRQSCRPLFKKFNVLTVYSIFIVNCILFFKQNMQYFSKRNNPYNVRVNGRIAQKNSSLTVLNNNTYNNITKICNKLPPNFLETDIKDIKRKLKKIFINEVLYSVEEYFNINFNVYCDIMS